MVTLHHFALPDLGEGLTEADILDWLVSPGDEVALNQPLVEVETAKAAVEVPSPWSGVVHQLLVPPGQTVPVGTRIISIETADELVAEAAQDMLVGYGPKPPPAGRRQRVASSADAALPAADVTVLAKPPVRRLARDLGVDLRTVTGTGPAGSITRADVDAVASGLPPAQDGAADRQQPLAADERIPLRGMRKAMAEAMTRSAFTAPHATVFLTVDATETMRLRAALADNPRFEETSITALAFVARAACAGVRRSPLINSEWDETRQEIVVHPQINLGIAVATHRGLLVPNIKNAGAKTLHELAGAIEQLTATARAGHTRPAELAHGTLSITNVGVFGVDVGTPLLNPGESAILCLGAIRPMPWVHDGQLAVRDVVQLALSFDHRIIDGQLAARFLADVGAMLADPRLLLALA
jgi:pyruvate dehydrogenase E2 component (dihydrolipoamide acetyltransferase)